MPDPLIVVGRIRRSHGVKGVVVVEPMTAQPELAFSIGRVLVAGSVTGETSYPERLLLVDMSEPFQGGFRVHLEGIDDRNEADRWRDRYLLAPRNELPEPAPGELYLADLVGFAVAHRGNVIGSVETFYELPHDVMLEVSGPGTSVVVPYRFVSSVDVAARTVFIDPPEGLL